MAKVCVKCQLELRPDINGIVAVLMASFGPYELYEADTWKCPGCEWVGVLGFASQPFARHYEPEFAKRLANAEVERVVVCFWPNEREKNSPNAEGC